MGQNENSLDCWFSSFLCSLSSTQSCEIFYVLFTTRRGFLKNVLHFKGCGDDDDDNYANCFSLLDSTCRRAAPKTTLGL